MCVWVCLQTVIQATVFVVEVQILHICNMCMHMHLLVNPVVH